MNQKHFKFLIIYFLLFLNIFTSLSAQTEFPSKISAVTVYNKGAKVTRTASVKIQEGISTLVFSNVYQSLKTNTLQVEIANKNISILDVNFTKNYLKAPANSKELAVLKDSLKIITRAINWIQHQKTILEGEEAIIKSNKNPSAKDGSFAVESLKELTIFYRERLLEIRQEIMDLQEASFKNQETKNRLNKAIRSLEHGGKYIGEISVKVLAQRTVSTILSLNYLINEAGWVPIYDLKSSGINQPMAMTYRGRIYQRTGFDWENVELSLSSAQPTIDNTQPTLSRMLISIDPVYQLDTVLTFEPETYEEQVAIVRNEGETWSEISTTPTSFQYNLEELHTIKGDGKQYFITIQDMELPASYEYFSIPKKKATAFLVAKITDYGKYNLLSGDANLFFENTFLGTARINSQTTKDTLQISLGRDLGIVIQREQKQFTAPKFIGNSVKETFRFDLIIRNNKSEKVTIELKDQLPVSTHKDLEVKLLEKNGAKFNPQTGILTWQLKLSPNETKKIPFSYSLKYPKEKRVWVEN